MLNSCTIIPSGLDSRQRCGARYLCLHGWQAEVTLHEEHAQIVRRAVSDPSYVQDIDWSDQTVEVLETAEQAVVSKSSHIAEEVVVGKTGSDHVETIKDTVRRQQVEVERVPSTSVTGKA